MTLTLLFIATLLLAGFTLLPLSRREYWWIRGLDFPRMQFAVFALLLILLQLLLLDLARPATWGMLLIALACLAYQAWWILPYTPLVPVEVRAASAAESAATLRIMTANVLTPNRNAAGLLELVDENRPDVLVTLESDAWWQAQLEPLHRDYPHRVECPLDNLYGMHLFSRLEIVESSVEYLVEDDVPSIHVLVAMHTGPSVRMHFLHPAPPSPTQNEESAERDAELLMVAKSVADERQPTIVAGDLNDVAWSATTRLFRRISGMLDPRVGRGMFNTYHAGHWFVRWPLDHLFHSADFTLRQICRLRGFGSDHFPLLTELVYQPAAGMVQSAPAANADDEARARAKLDARAVDAGDVPQPGNEP